MSPLAKQNPLAQLNDIIAPTTANQWPPAPIYWGLLITFVLLIIASVYLFKHFKKQRVKQQQALTKLQQLQTENASFITLNQLLKGVVLSHFPRDTVASLHGECWFDFLQNYSAKPLFSSKDTFLQRLYNSDQQNCSADDFTQSKIWIKQLPKQIKKYNKEAKKHV